MSTGSRIDLADGVRLAGGDEVAAAELLGGQTRRRRDAVHLQFEREDRLRRAEAAKRAVRRRVGRDRLRADAHVRAVVRTGGVNRPARQHDRRQRAVRAAVDDELDVHRQQPAVGDRSRCDAASAPDAAWSWRPCPRAGRRSSSPAGPPSTRAARRDRRGSTGIPPCRRTRRRSPSGPRGCVRTAGRTARRARGECSRGTASSPTPSRPTRDRRRRACRSVSM